MSDSIGPGSSTLPWFRDELRNKMAALEQEIAAHRHTLELLRQTERAYGRFVPSQVLALLNVESILDLQLGEQTERHMTVMFSDIRDFTRISEAMLPREVFAFINSYLGEMEPVISRHGGIVDKYIGDAIMAIFPSSADDGLRCAIAMMRQLEFYNAGRERAGYAPIRIGIGLNAGLVMLGTVGGTQRMEGTVISDAVNLASRLEDATKVFRTPLLVSESLVGSLSDASRFNLRFLDRMRIKGKSQPQSIYEVFDSDDERIRSGKESTRARFEEAVAYYHLREVTRALPLLEECLREVPSDYPAQIYRQRCHEYLESGQHSGTGEINGTLEWRDEFTLGVESIDAEHRELVNNISRFGAAVLRGDRLSVNELLPFLEDYAQTHFENEENLMRSMSYPMLEQHTREHRSFGARFERLKADIAAAKHDRLYLCFQVELFLIDWLANHIMVTDRHLATFLKRGPAKPGGAGNEISAR